MGRQRIREIVNRRRGKRKKNIKKKKSHFSEFWDKHKIKISCKNITSRDLFFFFLRNQDTAQLKRKKIQGGRVGI